MLETGLEGRRALISGASTGLGASIAIGLARERVDLALAARSGAPETLAEVTSLGGRAVEIRADVSREADVVRMVGEAAAKLGGLDLYVNVAAGAWHEPVTDLTREAWERTLATNVTSCALACREVGRIFRRQRSGCILAIGSTAIHTPAANEGAYRASKAALKALVEVVSIEMAPHGVRANLLTPGAFDTRLFADVPDAIRRKVATETPLRRIGRPEELVGAAILLLSDRLSAFTTGAELVVDGGISLRPI